MTDNTYSLASPAQELQWLKANLCAKHLDIQTCSSGPCPMCELAELHKSADSAHLAASTECARANKAEGELAEARSLLETIANSTEHADAAQKFECAKAEMLEVMRSAKSQIEYLHGKFRETGSGNQTLAQLEKVISKYEAK